jgi:hypothetical protein
MLQSAAPVAPAQQAQQTLQLEDIHLPASPTLWPPAPGWWIAFALLLAVIGFSGVRAYRYRKIRRQRQHILNALKVLQQDLAQQADPEAFVSINQLLRRLALMFYPREQVASLTGRDWLEFLDRSGNTHDFTQGMGRLLGDAPYQNQLPENIDIAGFSAVVERWVKQMTREVKA